MRTRTRCLMHDTTASRFGGRVIRIRAFSSHFFCPLYFRPLSFSSSFRRATAIHVTHGHEEASCRVRGEDTRAGPRDPRARSRGAKRWVKEAKINCDLIRELAGRANYESLRVRRKRGVAPRPERERRTPPTSEALRQMLTDRKSLVSLKRAVGETRRSTTSTDRDRRQGRASSPRARPFRRWGFCANPDVPTDARGLRTLSWKVDMHGLYILAGHMMEYKKQKILKLLNSMTQNE